MASEATRTERLAAILQHNPVIASIKDDAGLERMLASRSRLGFLLYGTINSLPEQLRAVAAARKLAFVDIDLIDGLSADAAGVGFLRSQFGARGLLSSKSAVVKAATQTGMVAIHRHFMIDSMAFHSLSRLIRQADPDAVEILPGCIPKVIGWLRDEVPVPLIAGGLIHDEDDVETALRAGAAAIATSNSELWDYQPNRPV
ncbi:MAG: glycerol-3-phosphate responsive antiterminator [Brooklawnia sp.]|uniref:glycerol-3-phosphate responsive antiterminator n=1 Tax=Brooklawnia sp. TaxID=2699740 RepID=UPI003C7553BA